MYSLKFKFTDLLSISRSSVSINHTSPLDHFMGPLGGPGGDLVVVAQVSEDGKVDEPATLELPRWRF